ncbi:hypothetical protein GCM10009579_82850 [Streptomyces javensis]|uniref:Uncharacterized protein n=1 Tax=Streptomyces javensis TaxID=114698 RepID=A0ABN1XDA1_9ACTN
MRIAFVAETHVHNDYVTGGLELARVTGADYLVPAGASVAFARTPVADGDTATVDEGGRSHSAGPCGRRGDRLPAGLGRVGGGPAQPHGLRRGARGRLNFEGQGELATYLARLIPWGKPVTNVPDNTARWLAGLGHGRAVVSQAGSVLLVGSVRKAGHDQAIWPALAPWRKLRALHGPRRSATRSRSRPRRES